MKAIVLEYCLYSELLYVPIFGRIMQPPRCPSSCPAIIAKSYCLSLGLWVNLVPRAKRTLPKLASANSTLFYSRCRFLGCYWYSFVVVCRRPSQIIFVADHCRLSNPNESHCFFPTPYIPKHLFMFLLQHQQLASQPESLNVQILNVYQRNGSVMVITIVVTDQTRLLVVSLCDLASLEVSKKMAVSALFAIKDFRRES